MSEGKLITFEGLDGCGKSTQINLLAQNLRTQGYDVLLTREPGGSLLGQKIRQLLLDPNHDELADHTEAFLYAADRAQHIAEVIKPALAAGKIVLCDRYVDSTIAYQGYGRGLELDFLEKLNQLATTGLMPSLTFYLMLPLKSAQDRLANRANTEYDRIEQQGEDFHGAVAQGFEVLARANPQRFCTIPAEQTATDIAEVILAITKKHLKNEA